MRLCHVTRAELLQWIQVTAVRDAIVHPGEHAELLAMVVGEILEEILVGTADVPQRPCVVVGARLVSRSFERFHFCEEKTTTVTIRRPKKVSLILRQMSLSMLADIEPLFRGVLVLGIRTGNAFSAFILSLSLPIYKPVRLDHDLLYSFLLLKDACCASLRRLFGRARLSSWLSWTVPSDVSHSATVSRGSERRSR